LDDSDKPPSRLNGRTDVVDVGEVLLVILARLEGLANPELEVDECICDILRAGVPYLEFVALAFEGGTLLRIRFCGPVEEILEDFGVPICDPALLNDRTPGDDTEDLTKASSAELLLTRLNDLGRVPPVIDCVILYIDI